MQIVIVNYIASNKIFVFGFVFLLFTEIYFTLNQALPALMRADFLLLILLFIFLLVEQT